MTEDIITRLQEATGPDRELDAAIWWLQNEGRAVYWNAAIGKPHDLPCDFSQLPEGLGKAAVRSYAPHYTASLDAALPWENIVSVEKTSDGWFADHLPEGKKSYETVSGKGATEPLARRIAAMKARADD